MRRWHPLLAAVAIVGLAAAAYAERERVDALEDEWAALLAELNRTIA